MQATRVLVKNAKIKTNDTINFERHTLTEVSFYIAKCTRLSHD